MSPLDFFHMHPEVLEHSLDLLSQEVVYIDPSYTILWMNKAKQKAHPGLETGMHCYEAFGKTSPCEFCLAPQAQSLGSNIKNPVCLMTGKHQNIPRHINIMISPVAFREEKIQGYIEIVDNVEALYQSNEELERLNHEYESVIYALSHDLRSPLVSIEGFLSKLKKATEATPDPAVIEHCLNRIRANTKTMNNLVNVLLDTSRIITGSLERVEVNVEEAARHAAEQFAEKAAAQNAVIKVFGEFGIEECDRVRLDQIFANLINNALYHCTGTPNLVIELGGKKHVYWVKDNGPGIPADFQESVFEPFSQAKKTSGKNFGMGLNIVYRIIQKHGGEIWIESPDGAGTAIFFTFKGDAG
ncbi:MAG: HAMP domain-containing histidine kinase [Spirochaetales bacterium]|nr:HAMP domain-containing histidine kinase [Spirochaetales bacterium]